MPPTEVNRQRIFDFFFPKIFPLTFGDVKMKRTITIKPLKLGAHTYYTRHNITNNILCIIRLTVTCLANNKTCNISFGNVAPVFFFRRIVFYFI